MNYTIKETKKVVTTVEEVVESKVTLKEYIGIKLKELREEKDYKIVDVERQTITAGTIKPQISGTQISNIEKGTAYTSIDHLEILANVFNVHISHFFPVLETKAE